MPSRQRKVVQVNQRFQQYGLSEIFILNQLKKYKQIKTYKAQYETEVFIFFSNKKMPEMVLFFC